jgi:hypothetical protein
MLWYVLSAVTVLAFYMLEKKRIIFFQAQLRYLSAETIRLTEPHAEDGSVVPNVVIGELLLRAGRTSL